VAYYAGHYSTSIFAVKIQDGKIMSQEIERVKTPGCPKWFSISNIDCIGHLHNCLCL